MELIRPYCLGKCASTGERERARALPHLLPPSHRAHIGCVKCFGGVYVYVIYTVGVIRWEFVINDDSTINW